MAGSLEFSKLVIASLLHTYWGQLNKILRTYLTIACSILILITSAGIYGFLSAAYQETANKVESIDKQNGNLDKQKTLLLSDVKRYESQISLKDNRITTLSELKSKQQNTMDNLISKNSSTKNITNQMSSIDAEISKLDIGVKALNDSMNVRNEKIKALDMQSLTLQTNQDVAKEIGPLKYIAKLTNRSLDQVVNYFIIALMLVFDPLAIALVLSSNFLFSSLNSTKTAVTSSQEEDINVEDEEEIDEENEEEDEITASPAEGNILFEENGEYDDEEEYDDDVPEVVDEAILEQINELYDSGKIWEENKIDTIIKSGLNKVYHEDPTTLR
jgi:hypothetical protein